MKYVLPAAVEDIRLNPSVMVGGCDLVKYCGGDCREFTGSTRKSADNGRLSRIIIIIYAARYQLFGRMSDLLSAAVN